MKVFFIFIIFIASVCAENNNLLDIPVVEILTSEIKKPIIETLIKEIPKVEEVKKLKETEPVKEKIEPVEEEIEPVKEESETENKKFEPVKEENEQVNDEKLSIEPQKIVEKIEDVPNEKQRIASGVDATVGENLEYVLLTIIFYNQMQTCGGILVQPQYVVTTASCVKDPVEGVASIVNATFPQVAGNNVATKLQIFIHEGYDQTTYANNIAVIKLSKPAIVDNKTLALANYTTDMTPDIYVNKTLRLCGFGSIANYYTKPLKLKCTDMFVQPSVNCSTVTNTICTFWTDRDNNACNNDFGGPLYLYSYNGTKFTQSVVGMASYSPDYRPNAPCYGGQKIVNVNTAFYVPWITNIISTSELGPVSRPAQ
ncbi:hypothetical protein PVAND_001631 [Polypedilum vanderplanki]|uniref:Peptidase S1 domain-containing protein n=1 Tax=Polypedilum vanderplanki TaxID=319348 RepID=A0A9J6BPU6_POLVA|nr:hypothetical protein PVAND_001631 [Polypedilum vanderplanki]